MSAFLCTDDHIFEMANYYIKNCEHYNNDSTFKEIAELLYNENVASLQARYHDEEHDLIAVNEQYDPIVTNVFHMAKLVNCYMYQSCEHEEWHESEARVICETIKSLLLTKHPDYDQAPWGFEREEYIEKVINKK